MRRDRHTENRFRGAEREFRTREEEAYSGRDEEIGKI
jgi:hypothetical protein